MIGETVGNFEIISQLGKGGMGAVYLAQQRITKTKVAIKVLQSGLADAKQVERFFGEAVAVGQIHHSGIVKIFDVGHLAEHDHAPYLVMEYLQGETLTSRIKQRGKLSIADVADYGRQIASVLEATHGAGITHRDLKPDNIYLIRDAELPRGERIKVLDFGIARYVRPSGPRMTSLNAGSVGTPNYMSPEQWHSLADVDWRTDAYALGCVMFEMACGRPPFIGESMADVCAQHLGEPPPVPSIVTPGLPKQLDAIILQLLEKEPAARPTMREVMQVLSEIGHGEGLALTTLPPRMMSPFAATRQSPLPAESVAQQTALQASPPLTQVSDAPAKKSRVGIIIALLALLVGGTVGAAVVISSQKSDDDTSKNAVKPGGGDPIAHQTALADAATVEPPPSDAASATPTPPDAAVASVPADAATTSFTPTPPDAGVSDEPNVRQPLVLAALPRFKGTPPTVAKQTTVRVCFDERGKVVDVTSKPDLSADAKRGVMKLVFTPHRVNGTAVDACGPMVLRAKPAIATDPQRDNGGPPDLSEPPDPNKPPDHIPSNLIDTEVRRVMAMIVHCGERNQFSGPTTLQVKVAADGSARLVGASPGYDNKPFRECVAGHIAKLKFPATSKGGKGSSRVYFPEQPAPAGDGY